MRRKPGTSFLVIACILIVLSLGTTYNSITIDGTKDFATDEAVAGTSGSTWYFTWDANAIYLGAENVAVGSNSSANWILWYIDTDPRAVSSQGTGSLTGMMYNTQQPALPFTANFHLRWKTDDSFLDLQTYNGSGWTTGDQSGIQHTRSGNYIEIKIPRSNLESPDQIYVCGAMINETAMAEWTYYIVPALQSDAYNPALTHYLGFTLDSGRSPNDGAYVDQPLPVQLMSFRGSALAGGEVELAWSTASEVENYGFEVQRASGGSNAFAAMPDGFVHGHGTTVERHDYTFVDRTAGSGMWAYRLKQIDLDGSIHFSDAIEISVPTGVTAAEPPLRNGLTQNYPNPFNPSTLITYQLSAAGRVRLTICDLLGREVAVLVNETKPAGSHEVRFQGSQLAGGLYFCRMSIGTFEATRKMLLLR